MWDVVLAVGALLTPLYLVNYRLTKDMGEIKERVAQNETRMNYIQPSDD